MRQHMFATTVATKTERIKYSIFRGIRDGFAIHVQDIGGRRGRGRGRRGGRITEFFDFFLIE